MNRLGRHLGVFAAVLAIVLVVAAVGPAVLGPSSGTSVTGQSPEQYQPSNLQLDTYEESGSVNVGGSAATKTVAIDLTHSNGITREDLSPLISGIVEAGHEVRFVGSETGVRAGSGSEFNATLRGADAFVVAEPGSSFSPTEVDAIEAYADAGGRVLVLEDAPSSGTASVGGIVVGYSSSSVDTQADNLASRFGVAFGTSYLYDMANGDTNFQAVSAGPSGSGPLLDGVEEVVFREAVPVRTGDEADALVTTTDSAALESTRERGEYPVLARNGNVVAVGDVSFLTPDSFREADNEVLVGNLGTFLVSGQKDPSVPSSTSGESPTTGPSTETPRTD